LYQADEPAVNAMLSVLTAAQVRAISAALSAPRLEPYIEARERNRRRALALDRWNAIASAALMVPIHLCEVVLRNAVVEAIEAVYGPAWHTAGSGFERSLPTGTAGYSPLADLASARAVHQSAGKVIPELKFMFWVSMLTRRHDSRLWIPTIRQLFPNLPRQLGAAAARRLLHDQVEAIRVLRNRLAHHEPIFTRDLLSEYRRIRAVVLWRSLPTADWLDSMQTVTVVAATKP
jgi:hypothetical protein